MPDTFYEVPEIAANFHIYSPLLDGSPRASVLSDLFCMSFQEAQAPLLYMAETAGLNASLGSGDYYLALSLEGYSEKLSSLAAQVCSQLTKIIPSREEYALYKQRLEIALSNASKDMPIIQARDILANALFSLTPTQQQKLVAIRKLSYEDFLEFSANLFSTVYSEGMVYGNCSEQGARELASSLENSLLANPYSYDAIPQRKARILDANSGPFVITEPTETPGKASSRHPTGASYFATLAQLIANAVLHEMFFVGLRTK
jgi:insulysin